MRLAWECIEYAKLMWTCQNDLSFSLCAVLSVCYIVIILENWIKSKVRMNTDIGMSLLNTRDQVQ